MVLYPFRDHDWEKCNEWSMMTRMINESLYKKTLHIFQGQFKQARIVDLFYNQSKTNGFFFEAGAYDGVAVSNSLFFELNRGWTGLLVEAHPDNYERLLDKNRKVWSLGNCISMSAEPEIVIFDAATIFGGIIIEGRPKPGDSIPVNQREEMQRITELTRRSIKVRWYLCIAICRCSSQTSLFLSS